MSVPPNLWTSLQPCEGRVCYIVYQPQTLLSFGGFHWTDFIEQHCSSESFNISEVYIFSLFYYIVCVVF